MAWLKRHLVFAGRTNDTSHGWDRFHGSFDAMPDLHTYLVEMDKWKNADVDWVQIVDTVENRDVEFGRTGLHILAQEDNLDWQKISEITWKVLKAKDSQPSSANDPRPKNGNKNKRWVWSTQAIIWGAGAILLSVVLYDPHGLGVTVSFWVSAALFALGGFGVCWGAGQMARKDHK